MTRRSSAIAASIAIVLAIGIGAALTLGVGYREPNAVWDPPGREMAPLSERRSDINAYYKLGFLEDGYPAREVNGNLVPHPIYGTYVIADYLGQYRQNADKQFLDAARTVADAALARMTPLDDGLVFYYTPEMGLSSLPGTFYSGLTQARWIATFAQIWKVTGDQKYLDAAEKSLASLMIPVEKGGVLRRSHGGSVIEEWPNAKMPDFTLNGWTTAMRLVAEYAQATGSLRAQALFNDNMVALKALLPLYDVPELANSRYRLSGPTKIRVSSEDTKIQFRSGAIAIPDIGSFDFAPESSTHWENYVLADGGDEITLHANLNMVSFPEENVLKVQFEASKAGTAIVEIETGEYEPLRGAAGKNRWVELQRITIGQGINEITTQIPWKSAELVAYPTNFAKKISGKNYNAYHFIHINNLRSLFAYQPDEVLQEYANKWESYVKRWPDMSVYTNAGVELISISEAQAQRYE